MPEHKVHVAALYTATADEKQFEAQQEATVAEVIAEAYSKLKEERRPNDRYFSHDEPRTDLTPYLRDTLESLRERGLFVHERHHQLTFAFDIDTEPGGAVA
jgi:hypothetical protein